MATTKTVLSFEGERELVTEARAHELVQSYADAEAQAAPPAFTHITLRNKSYTLEAARVIAAFFSRLEARGAFAQLTSVDFADMIAGRPEDEALQVLATLCDALSAIKTLTRIDLSDNALGEKGVRACFGLLQNQEQLKHMYFCNNGISAAAAGVIAQEVLLFRGLDTPTKLETFHFYNNMSGDGGAIALTKLLPLSPALKDLRFSATRAQREGSLAFATALASLKKLEKLDLSDNTFKAQGPRPSPPRSRTCQTWRRLTSATRLLRTTAWWPLPMRCARAARLRASRRWMCPATTLRRRACPRSVRCCV